MEFSSTIAAIFTTALLLAAAQAQQPDCVSKLVVCIKDLNSTKPSAQCCTSIKQVYETQLPCLCSLYRNPALLVGVNITQALELPKHCNLSANTSACNAVTPNSAPASSAGTPPATHGGNTASQMSRMGMPALLLVSALAALSIR